MSTEKARAAGKKLASKTRKTGSKKRSQSAKKSPKSLDEPENVKTPASEKVDEGTVKEVIAKVDEVTAGATEETPVKKIVDAAKKSPDSKTAREETVKQVTVKAEKLSETTSPEPTVQKTPVDVIVDQGIPEKEEEVEMVAEIAAPEPVEIKREKDLEVPAEKVADVAAPVSEPEKQVETLEKPAEVQESIEDIEIPLVSAINDDVFLSAESENVNETSMLADESIISVPESPMAPKSPVAAPVRPRDSTFSPVVDGSIHDSRPNIDLPVEVSKPVQNRQIAAFGDNFDDKSPVFAPAKVSAGVASVALRTSTPYANRLAQKVEVGTPKRSATKALVSRAKTPGLLFDKPVGEEAKVNPLEKSILKSSRRKRSMSVADCESFAQKRVMFISPKIMDIGEIDEKMMASFIEEKENSMMRLAASGSRRKRSLSTGTPAKKVDSAQKLQSRVKMPNFKAIHEQQFQKMESIAEHAARKVERAKKLATPVKDGEKKAKKSTESEVKPAKKAFSFSSKIPTRKAFANSSENLTSIRTLKRSMSENNDEPPRKKQTVVAPVAEGPSTSKPRKVAVASGLQRSASEKVKQAPSWVAPTSSSSVMTHLKNKLMATKHDESQSVAQQAREKVEERRNRNMSLYKQGSRAVERRVNNSEMLKGVRLNRRFELQMQHRREHPETS